MESILLCSHAFGVLARIFVSLQEMDPSPSTPSPNMEGFGSADVSTPFHYGSVHDGQYRSDSFEQKLKKQYWKTKQTVIQKLGKNQDEFIVAGDAEIDTKLEVIELSAS